MRGAHLWGRGIAGVGFESSWGQGSSKPSSIKHQTLEIKGPLLALWDGAALSQEAETVPIIPIIPIVPMAPVLSLAQSTCCSRAPHWVGSRTSPSSPPPSALTPLLEKGLPATWGPQEGGKKGWISQSQQGKTSGDPRDPILRKGERVGVGALGSHGQSAKLGPYLA